MKRNQSKSIVCPLLVAMVIATSSIAISAERKFFLTMHLSSQGTIKSKPTKRGKDVIQMPLVGMDEGSLPMDIRTGLAAGRRRHNPITIRAEASPEDPQIEQAFAASAKISDVWILIDEGKPGQETRYGAIQLTNATISAVKHIIPKNGLNKQVVGLNKHEITEISFTYQKIVYTLTQGGKTFQDDWLTGS